METRKSPGVQGRPRAFNIDIALDQALLLFWRKGYLGTSLSDLTEAMGINRPSLYAAFGNKETLFRKALGRYREALSANITNSCPRLDFSNPLHHRCLSGFNQFPGGCGYIANWECIRRVAMITV